MESNACYNRAYSGIGKVEFNVVTLVRNRYQKDYIDDLYIDYWIFNMKVILGNVLTKYMKAVCNFQFASCNFIINVCWVLFCNFQLEECMHFEVCEFCWKFKCCISCEKKCQVRWDTNSISIFHQLNPILHRLFYVTLMWKWIKSVYYAKKNVNAFGFCTSNIYTSFYVLL